ncbi:MAG: S9 family peptidase [Dehalococcoidales bacterium]|nr:S9 family peptidase [Dehalococcoidales bacterium]
MSQPSASAYGSWQSPITSAMIVSKSIGLGQIEIDREYIYWLESRPSEGGRSVVVRRSKDGEIEDITPQPFNVRTTVHEYGGGAYLVHNGTVYFSNFSDQRLYRHKPGFIPVPLTPAGSRRYADGVFDARRQDLVCVCEEHRENEVENSLARIDINGSGTIKTLASGHDFYASPRLDPDGTRLVWLAWDHPNMPWDSSELWCGDIGPEGSIISSRKVAGGPQESICQPEYSPDGTLYYVSDINGWWNLYRWKDGKTEPVYEMEADFGVPHWVFGESRYTFTPAGKIICSYIRNGTAFLGRLDPETRRMEKIESRYTWSDYLRASENEVIMVAGSPVKSSRVVKLDTGTCKEEVLKESSTVDPDPRYISSPQAIEFPTEKGLSAHAFYYPPANRDFAGLPGELPPLLIFIHGGPTGQANSVFNLSIQFWTSRGFAVANVNYGGSSGFGRAYRQRLNGQWGIVDVDDCLNCARYLVEKGLADECRLAIRGGSAGGYTTLAALTFRSLFRTGASYYGVSDIEALASDTHKFESHYMESLVGLYPGRRDLYLERSPINFVDRLSSPVIFFQGSEDRIVPPDQSEKMVDALRRKGLPVAYLLFEKEQHGFRMAENIRRALEAELYFYGKMMGFEPAGTITPVQIENYNSSVKRCKD